MKKTFWVMKTPGIPGEWVEMDGKQFYEFITSPAGKGRYFINFGNSKIECMPEQYREWKREANHSVYLQGFEEDTVIISLDTLFDDDAVLGDAIADPSPNIEDKVLDGIEKLALRKAVQSLSKEELQLITYLFFLEKRKTETELATLLGISKQAVNKRKDKIQKN